MELVLGRDYLDRTGHVCVLVAVEKKAYDLWRLVLRRSDAGRGSFIIPAMDAAKWLAPHPAETSR